MTLLCPGTATTEFAQVVLCNALMPSILSRHASEFNATHVGTSGACSCPFGKSHALPDFTDHQHPGPSRKFRGAVPRAQRCQVLDTAIPSNRARCASQQSGARRAQTQRPLHVSVPPLTSVGAGSGMLHLAHGVDEVSFGDQSQHDLSAGVSSFCAHRAATTAVRSVLVSLRGNHPSRTQHKAAGQSSALVACSRNGANRLRLETKIPLSLVLL